MTTKEEIKTDLPEDIFDVPMNTDLLHQVIVSQMANKRYNIAHSKDRSEVSGGGIKPWRQKGTGRARHGSIRSPIWIGGGVTHGPTKDKIFKKKLPKKIKRKGLFIALSDKARNNLIKVVDNLKIEEIKTKKAIEMLEGLGIKGSCLIVLPKIDNNIILSTRNIPKVNTIQAKDINCLDVVSSKYLLIDKESIEIIKEVFKK